MSHEFSHRLERQMLDGPTCSLEDFIRAEAEDPNFRWRIQEGHVMNLLVNPYLLPGEDRP